MTTEKAMPKPGGRGRAATLRRARAPRLQRVRHAKRGAASTGPATVTPDAETIAARITDAIVERRLLPGTRLGEENLGAIFGVSRTKVREALFIVARYKLITWEPSKSACVAQPSVQEAREVFEARRVLEAATARKLAATAAPARLRLLRQQIERESRLMQNGELQAGTASGTRIFGDFHRLVAELAANAVLAGFVREVSARTSLVEIHYGTTMGVACSHDEHAGILAAIERRDTEGAAELMVRHLEHIEQSVVLRDATSGTVDLREALRG